jgi:hypothetical protein
MVTIAIPNPVATRRMSAPTATWPMSSDSSAPRRRADGHRHPDVGAVARHAVLGEDACGEDRPVREVEHVGHAELQREPDGADGEQGAAVDAEDEDAEQEGHGDPRPSSRPQAARSRSRRMG